MESGIIVEYIDRQRILCAVVLEVKDKRLRVLTENNREVNLPASRLSHMCDLRIDLSQGRQRAVEALKNIVHRREELIETVDIKELWEVLNSEREWIDLATMTEFCFPENPTQDHESAVIRAFFKDRFYFKFNPDRFFPYTEEQVQRIITQQEQAERRRRFIEEAAAWLKNNHSGDLSHSAERFPRQAEFVEILKSVYIHKKESPF